MTELNMQIENLISKGAQDFEISKVFKNHFKSYVESIDEILLTSGEKIFL